jgi:hypothetical protein
MRLPFTTEQFLDLFGRYNLVVWPTQLLLLALAFAAVVLAMRGGARDNRLVSMALAFLWLWGGVAYHLTYFTTINPAAWLFGALFVVEGVLLIHLGVVRRRLAFAPRLDPRGVTGALLVAYALLGYPLLGFLLGHRFPAAPTFGAPCPTTIFTLGLLLWAGPSLPRVLLAIPLAWAIVGTSAALQLGMIEDFGLPVAALLAVAAQRPASAFRRAFASASSRPHMMSHSRKTSSPARP